MGQFSDKGAPNVLGDGLKFCDVDSHVNHNCLNVLGPWDIAQPMNQVIDGQPRNTDILAFMSWEYLSRADGTCGTVPK